MNRETEIKIARSLTAENPELIPHLPYLLQDLWELGTPPDDIANLIKKYIPDPQSLRILDLACGKGAIGIPLAKQLGCTIKMVDIFPEFIDFARQKAKESNVDSQCEFLIEDINETVKRERNWDCTMLLAVGDVLGDTKETMQKLRETVRPKGYIIIEESCIDEENAAEIRCEYNYPTHSEWLEAIESAGLKLIGKWEDNPDWLSSQNVYCNNAIARRAQELSVQFPQQAELFREYVISQQNESYDVENTVEGASYLLQRI